jgi:general secretion pathway protein K
MRTVRSQSGYILALNIATLATVLVVASFVGLRMNQAVQLAQVEKQRLLDDFLTEDARARSLFMLATIPRSVDGLGRGPLAIKLDGRPYLMSEGIVVRMQDARGLVPLGALAGLDWGRERILRLISGYSMPPPMSDALTDALLDYRDLDDLRRMNGAERAEYVQRGIKSVPRNGNPQTPLELARVFGWRQALPLWGEDPISDQVHLEWSGLFNTETADWRALAAMSGLAPEAAAELVDARKRGQIEKLAPLAFAGTLGDPFGANGLITQFPGDTVRLSLQVPGSAIAFRYLVAHDPTGNQSPWRIRYAEVISSAPITDVATIPKLPDAREINALMVLEPLKSPF